MPRPGPRPYECVRRAWHSDRHQPIRGSIIQKIFRVVTEAHSSATRKNIEWQKKLPQVVLKAEEILYSKANSEAEYVDPDTLWERLNDAIDTIIRRDESTETGQYLQPCIEAALVLGCVPIRASRSQRNSNPRSYLNPQFQEPAQAAPAVNNDKPNYYRPPPQPQNFSGSPLSISRSTMGNQATCSLSSTQMATNASYIATHPGPYTQPNFPRLMPSMAVESNSSLNFGSVYPLYYGSQIQNADPHFGFQSPQTSNPRNVIIGTPVGWRAQPPCFSSTRNLLPGENEETAAEKHEPVSAVECRGEAAETDCDLSLRLGPSQPTTSVGKGLGRMMSDGGSSSHRDTSTSTEPWAKNVEFCYPRTSGNDISESSNKRLEQDAILRKRKAPDNLESEDGRAQWLQGLQPNQFHGQYYRWPGGSR